MNPEQFKSYWTQTYPNSPPVGYMLREKFHDIWFRIHTLPCGKRYPDTKEEELEILRRHNTLLCDLFTENKVWSLLATDYSSLPAPSQSQLKLRSLDQNLQYFMSYRMEEEDDPHYWHFYWAERKWIDGSVDKLLREIVEDEIQNVLLVDTIDHFVYHPFDGGADIFVRDKLSSEQVKSRYFSWKSQQASGL